MVERTQSAGGRLQIDVGSRSEAGGRNRVVVSRAAVLAVCLLLFTPSALLAQESGLRLIEAARQQQLGAVRALLPDTDVDATQPDGATALHWATYRDDEKMVRLLVDAGADPGAANDLGVTPLVLACENGNPVLV